MPRALAAVVIDCHDPARLSAFWAGVLGGQVDASSESWVTLAADPVVVAFQRVPEGKGSPKNRLHLDVVDEDLESATAEAEALGARRVSDVIDEGDGGFIVLQDPEGNEFCFVTP